MKRPDPEKKGKTERRPEEEHEQRERTVAPPIEREHETQEGVFEHDKPRERERE